MQTISGQPFQFGMPLATQPQQPQQQSFMDFLNPQPATMPTAVGAPYSAQMIANSRAAVPPTIFEGLLNGGQDLYAGLQNPMKLNPQMAQDPSAWSQMWDFMGTDSFKNALGAAQGLATTWMGFQAECPSTGSV